MDLSRQLLKDFADVTRGVERDQTQYLRGTIKGSGEAKYVRIDGSESLTPISEVVDVQEGDRVLVTIENHEATILGNLTKPPSAYKEQEAIDKAEDAQNSANAAGEAAEDAKSLAQSAGNKADAAVVDATNASASANQAKQDAAEAMTAAENASKNSTEAKELATAAGQNATTAREEAAAAQNAATAAQGEVTRIEGVVTGVKGDIDTALKEVADQAADLQATKETLEVTYAKKTEVSDVQAALTTEISKKVGELQTTVSQTYAAKNDVVEMEGRLQTQITQTSGEVSSVVGKVEQLESDTTEAKKKVDEALEKSAAAQVAAGQAQANATAAQTAADAAKLNADNATKKANEAVQNAANAAATAAEADRKVSAAKTDLDEAKVNLENTMNRVGATEQEIADAQKKVDAAQAAVTQAQKEAAEATLAANNAQSAANQAQTDATEAQNAATNAQKKADNAALAAGNAQAAADKAQQDVAALTKRVTSAETAITQNAEQIKLSANKTEEIGTKLDNLKVGGENLFLDAAFRNKFLNVSTSTSYVPGHWIAYNNHSSYKFGEYNGKTNYLQFTSTSKVNLGIIQFLDRVVLQPGKEYCIRLFTMCETSDYTIGIKLNKKSSNGSINWNYSNIFNKTVKASSNYSEISAKFTIPDEDDGVMYGISIFNGGTDISNGQTIKLVKPKLEEGNTYTDFSISSKDMAMQDDLTNNYYSKTQTDAAIKVAADNVTTTVRKEVTTEITNVNNKVDNLSIGSDNLIINGGFPNDTHGWKKEGNGTFETRQHSFYFNEKKRLFCIINNNKSQGYEGSEEVNVYSSLFSVKPYTDYTLTFVAFASQNISSAEVHYLGKLNNGDTGYSNIITLLNKSTVLPNNTCKYYQFTFNSGNSNVGYIRFDNNGTTDENDSFMFFGEGMLVEGTVAKKYQPSSADMATEGEVQQAQNEANKANGKADATENRVSVAESTIKQLSDSISMLVTDSNGSSMMTQTSDGWTFNISSITDSLSNAVNNLDNLTNSVEQSNSTLNNLKQLADDLSNKTAYINMSTDEVGSPCIELGKTDDPFKVRITNRSVDFMDGETKIAYVSNQTLYINQTVVRNELQIGDGSGFVWKTRSNGNLGLRWTTIAKIVITKYRYAQSSIDTYSKNGYTGTWTIVGSTNDINVGDIVKLGIFNTSTNRYNYIEANVNSKGKDNINTTSTGIVTMY